MATQNNDNPWHSDGAPDWQKQLARRIYEAIPSKDGVTLDGHGHATPTIEVALAIMALVRDAASGADDLLAQLSDRYSEAIGRCNMLEASRDAAQSEVIRMRRTFGMLPKAGA
jgi:hypothetical protein